MWKKCAGSAAGAQIATGQETTTSKQSESAKMKVLQVKETKTSKQCESVKMKVKVHQVKEATMSKKEKMKMRDSGFKHL